MHVISFPSCLAANLYGHKKREHLFIFFPGWAATYITPKKIAFSKSRALFLCFFLAFSTINQCPPFLIFVRKLSKISIHLLPWCPILSPLSSTSFLISFSVSVIFEIKMSIQLTSCQIFAKLKSINRRLTCYFSKMINKIKISTTGEQIIWEIALVGN